MDGAETDLELRFSNDEGSSIVLAPFESGDAAIRFESKDAKAPFEETVLEWLVFNDEGSALDLPPFECGDTDDRTANDSGTRVDGAEAALELLVFNVEGGELVISPFESLDAGDSFAVKGLEAREDRDLPRLVRLPSNDEESPNVFVPFRRSVSSINIATGCLSP